MMQFRFVVVTAWMALLAGPAPALAEVKANPVDTVIAPVQGYTWTAEGLQCFSALRIAADGRVVATGDAAHWQDEDNLNWHDGKGAVLLPGLIDAHAHVFALGRLRANLNLADTRSAGEALEQIRSFAEAHSQREWLTGRGWNQELWPEARFPTAAMIDKVVKERPVWLRRVDGHAGWANSAAMRAAGIDASTKAPTGGRILHDEQGNPSGILVDQAMALIESVIPPPGEDSERRALQLALQEMAQLGFTGAHDAGASLSELEIYRDFADRGQLSARIYVMLGGGEVLAAFGEPVIGYAHDRLFVRSVKLYADGALGSRGAALLEPYADEPGHRGLMFRTDAEMTALIQRANDRGFQAAVHAIGDAANRQVLDAFERVQKGQPSPLRNRIEHAQIVAPEDIRRFHELGIVASMQPVHATSDMRMAEKRLDPDRLKGAYAWRHMLAAGVALPAGSDFPVEKPDPFHGVHAAVTRQDHEGWPAGGWRKQEALTRGEALRAFTRDAAWAAHMEDLTGTLEAGKWADFILVDQDPFTIPAKDLWRIQVLETWLAGAPVYRADSP